jgi:hypothetical protein
MISGSPAKRNIPSQTPLLPNTKNNGRPPKMAH